MQCTTGLRERCLTASAKKLLFVDYILYGCAILGPKISILLQLVAIFVPPGRGLGTSARWFYWAALFLMAMNLIFYVAHNFVLIFQCNPVAKGWDSSIPGVCLDQVALLESSGPFNIISDLLIFLLPLSSIWQLKLPLKTRLGIGSAFAIGLLCVSLFREEEITVAMLMSHLVDVSAVQCVFTTATN